MAKTRSNKSSRRRTENIYDTTNNFGCYATFHGLDGWFKYLFEKLGWMILAKHYGMTDKIVSYKMSLQRFKECAEQKIKHTRDIDKKHDIQIMHKNICLLIEHAENDL